MFPLSAALLGFNCFVDEAWPASDVQVTRDVAYGSNFNNVTGEVQTLLLDIYEPPLSDNRTLRPGVVLVHGGSFLGGDKTSDGEPDPPLEVDEESETAATAFSFPSAWCSSLQKDRAQSWSAVLPKEYKTKSSRST